MGEPLKEFSAYATRTTFIESLSNAMTFTLADVRIIDLPVALIDASPSIENYR
jgi:hypothetical protein